jgi:uncharacterized protein
MSVWNNKNAIVCGGSSGLGLSVAECLVRGRAARVFVIGRDASKLKNAVEKLAVLAHQLGSPTLLTPLQHNLSDAAAAAACALNVAEFAPSIDLLVQCIGASDRGSLANLTANRLIELFNINVISSLNAIQQFAPSIAKSRGSLVLVGSLASLFAPRFLGGYSIVKHGVAALAQQARLELADQGVHVMLCCPGPIARSDAGERYQHLSAADVSAESLKPGGGAKLKGLDATKLAEQLLNAAAARRPILILPGKAWWLRCISSISPTLGDIILRRQSS